MRLRPISLLLLLALALRLGAGPHPCHAAVDTVAAQAASMPSCHGSHAQAPKAPDKAPKGSGCCDPKGNHSLCEQGCQRAAVLAVGLSAPADRPFQELYPAAAPATAAAVPFAIDHVPLA
ncbi:MAG: hypothetical protein ACJ75H_04805 [Thermoanaerobaculia bacterium]